MEVEEGKRDLEIISTYIHKKVSKQDKSDGIKLKHSVNTSNKTDKQLGSSKKLIHDDGREDKREKIISLRGQILRKF